MPTSLDFGLPIASYNDSVAERGSDSILLRCASLDENKLSDRHAVFAHTVLLYCSLIESEITSDSSYKGSTYGF